MSRPAPRDRRLLLRLAKFSPLVAVGFVTLVGLSLPLSLTANLIMSENIYGGVLDVGDEVAFQVDATDALRRNEAIGLGFGDTGQEPPTSSTWSNVARLYTVDATPAVLSGALLADDPVFDPLLEWEQRYGGDVWAWTVLSPERPPVVAVGVGTAATSEALERALADGTVRDRREFQPVYSVDDLWQKTFIEPYGDGAQPLDQQWFLDGWGIQALGADWQASTFTAGDEAWVALWHGRVSGAGGMLPTIPDLRETDPHSPDFADRVQTIADEHDLDMWILGPLQSRAIPLRMPEGATAEDAEALGDLVWPGLYIRSNTAFISSPVELSADEAAIAGRGAGIIQVWSVIGSPEYSSTGSTLSEPESIAFLYVVDEAPGGAPTPLHRAWRSWQVFLGHNLRLLVAISGVVLLASLGAALAAGIVGRREAARSRVATLGQ